MDKTQALKLEKQQHRGNKQRTVNIWFSTAERSKTTLGISSEKLSFVFISASDIEL